jgi:hypothetical protein
MTPTEIQIIISIATILCSGVVSAVVTHKLSTGRAEREFRRKKLEELFFAVHTYCTKLFSRNIVWPQVMRGKISYDDANGLIIQNHDKQDKSHDVMEMLVNIYFPELRPHLLGILNRRDQINTIYGEFTKSYKRQENCECYIQPFLDELSAIDTDEKAMTNSIFRLSEKYR